MEEYLGLFDTPPRPKETRVALVLAGLLFASLLIILPVRDTPWPEIGAFVPVIDAVMFVGELIIATLFFAQASVFRSRALAVLATGYAFSALLLISHALTFPGAFAPNGLLGSGVDTTAWIAVFRRTAFPIAFILYVQFKGADSSARSGPERPVPSVSVGVCLAAVLAAGVTLMATDAQGMLPSLFLDRREAVYTNLLMVNGATILLTVVAMAMLFSQRKSVLDVWLLVALSGWLAQTLLNLPLSARFTVGWYGLFMLMLVSNLIVLVALIAESNRMYAQLALSTAERNRDRDDRLMTMDAVAAAISHEVGQPLSASLLNARAGLDWLTRPRPNLERAIKALRHTIEDEQRTFDVIKSIRAMFTKDAGSLSEFGFDELVRETAQLLDRELAARKVSLELALDDELPPIMANRVQMQRVLINIMINAIESLGATRGRTRRIQIRSASPDEKSVQLEISDTGTGVAPDDMDRIFEPFFSTKARGTGLGLSLCRTIVEEHGGRLWASARDKHGMTFFLKLPRSEQLAA